MDGIGFQAIATAYTPLFYRQKNAQCTEAKKSEEVELDFHVGDIDFEKSENSYMRLDKQKNLYRVKSGNTYAKPAVKARAMVKSGNNSTIQATFPSSNPPST
ncbi:hypothetical protein L2E82_01099 [Cichorium intybus]|uniref:Uncharacterized protein n=1 Tax=Cichorium intybus TaxID=13427 RepID=A0ACB9GYS0_CICIN|nr:hypothetical protein L2E82_01099 [Cichorium intybus]